jgi:hypothetical protein
MADLPGLLLLLLLPPCSSSMRSCHI